MKKKILITGAGGFIGSHLVESMRNDPEYEVIAVCFKPGMSCESKKIKLFSLNLLKEKSWDILGKENPNIVVHCSAVLPHNISEKEAAKSNRILDDHFISFCDKNNCIAVYPSGTLVYGFSNESCNEDTPFDGKTEYIKEKIRTEQKIFSLKELNYYIFRISAPYGPNQKARTVIRIFIENALNRKNIFVFGRGKRQQDFTYVDDIIKAVLMALKSDKYGVYNIASGKPISMSDLARLIKGLVKSDSNIRNFEIVDPQESYKAYINIKKAKESFGWSPTYDIRMGLNKYIQFIIGE